MDFIKGGISGIFGLILSHPFDTIKSNIQNNQKSIYSIRFLYKGLTAPLFGIGIEKSIVFGVYNTLKKYDVPISINGFISGFMASFIITPYERIKILKQNSVDISAIKYNIKTLYAGYTMCMLRDSIGFAIYFSNYEYLKKKLYGDDKISNTGAFLIGGSSGLISWIFIYPQDKIKTIMQSNKGNLYIKDIIFNIYKNEGIFSFYKGFHFALYRAVPLHAGTFMMYELLSNMN